ncbi:hypothetical protein M5K25_025408 [Dendrobium thyrsiflorum]|uniref:BHLH domain-containing protein n=1 Tax=Dendrobium thyrsiflorum TaxID=117978 RepID=A0ABD0U4B8_DENTH
MDPFSSTSPIFSAEEELNLINGDLPISAFSPDPGFNPLTSVSFSLSDSSRSTALSNYTEPARDDGSSVQDDDDDNGGNIHRSKRELDGEKNGRDFQHMMRERLRRERLSQSFADLHSMLPLGTKAYRNSILKSTVMMVRELKIVEQEKQHRNHELLSMLKSKATTERSSEPSDEVEIKIKMPNTTPTVDSMINALHCLKEMDVKIIAIRSELSSEGDQELIMTIQGQIDTIKT